MIASSRLIAFRNQLDNQPDIDNFVSKLLEGLIMAPTAALPTLTAAPGFPHYLEEIRRFPMLERQEEYMLAKRWREHGDRGAAHKLITSHLRLVTKIARDYRGYGLPISEAISEGNVGLKQGGGGVPPGKRVPPAP